MRHTAFKRCKLFQDVLCCRDYDERVVAIFANQIQSEYYGENISVSIEGIELGFLSDDRKQDAATTIAHSKRFISLIKDKKVLTTSLSKIW